MPRKQNGFGSSQSFAFKGGGRVDKGKGAGAPGSYPGSRRYGTSVTRTVIEKYDLDSNWTKWRQGYEIWSKAYYSLLRVENPNYNDSQPEEGINIPYVPATLLSVLYQGTDYPTNVAFYGYEYPTMSADVNTHYVARRQPIKVDSDGNDVDISLGFVSQVFNDQLEYPEQKKFQEIWVKGTPNLRGRLLLQMVGERLTDGNTTATMKYLLGEPDRYCKDGVPAIYFGKTAPADVRKNSDADLQPTQVVIRLPKDSITLPQLSGLYRVNQGLSQKLVAPKSLEPGFNPQELVGKIVYMADFFKDRAVADFDAFVFIEDQTFFASFVQDSGKMAAVSILDPGVSQLPPSMYDISSLPQLLTSNNASYTLTGTYIFKKSDYQRFYGRNYLSADLVEERVTDASYSVFPFKILAVEDTGTELIIKSEPFNSEIQLYPPLTANGTLIFSDKSFTKTLPSDNPRFENEIYLDVDPWLDETFIVGRPLEPAVTYTCSCPSHSKSLLSTPQATEDRQQRKVNRQRRYPLPTVLSQDRFEGAGAQSVAGKVTTWITPQDRLKVNVCKHTVAAMFTDGLKVIEPNQYPTQEAREYFEDKMIKRFDNYDRDFRLSFERAGISLTEIVFALAQGLNLDNTETAYVVLNSNQ